MSEFKTIHTTASARSLADGAGMIEPADFSREGAAPC
jgi:hypothetical protein